MFYYQTGNLYCEEAKLIEIARQEKTPFYLYSTQTLIDNFKKCETAFAAVPHTICLALKANSNLRLLKILAQQGCGGDVVSGGELYLALQAGIPPDKIVFAGVGKTDEEIEYAIQTGVAAINVESPHELDVINQIAQRLQKEAKVALRINPDIDIHGHPYISTGKAFNKFGIDWKLAPALYQELHHNQPLLKPVGVHCHIGSMIFEMAYYQAAAEKLKNLVTELRQSGIALEQVDIGGGLGVNYQQPLEMYQLPALQPQADTPQPESLAQAVLPILKPLACRLFFEPGRFLMASAGVLITKVLFVKETRGNHFICVDTGMHHLIRPALYEAYHAILPLTGPQKAVQTADVVGPICESTDFLAKQRLMPCVKRGDYLAIMTAGAYGYSLATSYNGQPLPAEILVKVDSYELIRRRQTYEDFLSLLA